MSFSVILPTLNENGHIIKLIKEISQKFILNKKDIQIKVDQDNTNDRKYETEKDYQTR